MKEFFSILARCPLLEGIDPSDWDGLLTCLGAGVHGVSKNQPVISEGDPAKYVGIVLEGWLQVELVDYLGNRSILSEVHPGELFGESFACAGAAEMPVTVVAATDASVMLIDCQRITTIRIHRIIQTYRCAYRIQRLRHILHRQLQLLGDFLQGGVPTQPQKQRLLALHHPVSHIP